MSYWTNRSLYYLLLQKFIQGHIDGIEFEFQFMNMWKQDRDEELLTIKSNVIPQKHEGLIIPQDPLHDEETIESILSKVFTACDVFDPNPSTRSEYEYSESELRDFVHNILTENRHLFEQK